MKLVFFFSTTWTQGWYNPGCLAAVKFRTGVELRRGPAIHLPSSSRVALNVIFNFTAEVLLGGSTATVTWALQGWNVLEFTWTRAAGAPHCRVKPQQGTALPDSPESLLRGVCAPQESPLGNEVGKESEVHTHCLLSHNLCIQGNHTVLAVCAYKAQGCWAREVLPWWDPCASQAHTTFLECYPKAEPYSLVLNVFHPNTARGLCSRVHSAIFPDPIFVCCWKPGKFMYSHLLKKKTTKTMHAVDEVLYTVLALWSCLESRNTEILCQGSAFTTKGKKSHCQDLWDHKVLLPTMSPVISRSANT